LYVYETFSYFVRSFTNYYENMWPEREDKGSLEHHINRKFMFTAYQNTVVKFRKTQGAAQVVWNTGNVYST